MVIVNPYLRKSKAPPPSASQSSKNHKPPQSTPNKAANRPATSSSLVTPNHKTTSVHRVSSATAASNKAPPLVSPPPSQLKQAAVVGSVKAAQALPVKAKPLTSTLTTTNPRPPSGTAVAAKKSIFSHSSKVNPRTGKKLTLKQQLKQQIASLKKQKQLHQLQQEANERRRRMEEERAQKEAEYKKWMVQKEAEKQAKLQARQELVEAKQEAQRQKQLERQKLAQVKQEAIRLRQEERKAKQEAKEASILAQKQQAQADYDQAYEQYKSDAQSYRQRHQTWLAERQQWLQWAQSISMQAATVPTGQWMHPSLTGHAFTGQVASSQAASGQPFSHPQPHAITTAPTTLAAANHPPLLVRPAVPSSLSVHPSHSLATMQAPSAMLYTNPMAAANPYFWNTHPQLFHSMSAMNPLTAAASPRMPQHLMLPPMPPRPPRVPRCLQIRPPRPPKPVESPIQRKLCSVLESECGSPYAHTYELVEEEIVLIRRPDESYGVHLQAVSTSILVFPDQVLWKQPPKKSQLDASQGHSQETRPMELTSTGQGSSTEPPTPMAVEQPSAINTQPSQDEEMEDAQSSQPVIEESKTAPPVATLMQGEDVAVSQQSTGMDPSIENAKISGVTTDVTEESSKQGSQTMGKSTSPDAANNLSKELSSTPTNPTPIPPKRQRRRRVNFTVMMVIDASKQNARWEEKETRNNSDESSNTAEITKPMDSVRQPTETMETVASRQDALVDAKPMTESVKSGQLLQVNDIIVSIGGVDIAGITFQEACQIFAQKSFRANESEIRATVKVARKKKPTILSGLQPTKEMTPSSDGKKEAIALEGEKGASKAMGVDESRPSSLISCQVVASKANTSSEFSAAEIAFLADCMVQATHHPERLLGQHSSMRLLQYTSTLFRQVSTLKECILTHRSPSTLYAKWLELAQGIQSGLDQRSRLGWSSALEKESETKEDAGLLFASEPERIALRQLPRPRKGCRCKSEDHEYLHDIRCTLYRDVAKHLPAEELQQLQYNPTKTKGKAKTDGLKDLNTVETAYKDRMMKLKAATEMEEAEARFVARMEEVQVTQLRRAIYSPNLTSMVLSSIVELQREFPIKKINSEIVTDSTESSKKQRTHASIKHLSFKYLMRMAEFIGKTWGHVYQEPSHDDYAWRWELFHGHHSEDAKWEPTAKNPRTPGAFSFESWRYGLAGMVGAAANSRLAKASDALSTLETAIQAELAEQLIASQTPSPQKISFEGAGTLPSNSQVVSASPEKTSRGAHQTSSSSTQKTNGTALPSTPATSPAKTCTPQEKMETPESMKRDSTTISTSPEKKQVDAAKSASSNSPGSPGSEGISRATLNLSQETVEQLCLAAHLLSPASSGIYDELMALVQMGVLDIQLGIPRLATEWASKVDVVILEDMDEGWGTENDPNGQYCINVELKDTLEEEWTKSADGWSLIEDPDDLIFDLQVLEEWRQAFGGQQEERAKISEGIGRFGL